jgi:hypothetical protein
MTIDRRSHPMAPVPAPTKHELAFMIWLAVFATLTVLNLLSSLATDATHRAANIRTGDDRSPHRHLRGHAAAAPRPRMATQPQFLRGWTRLRQCSWDSGPSPAPWWALACSDGARRRNCSGCSSP